MKKLGIEKVCGDRRDESIEPNQYVPDVGQGDFHTVLPINKDIVKTSKYPPDECFAPQKPTSSHEWVMDDESQKEPWISEVHSNYQVPKKASVANGIRYQLQYKQAMAEAIHEMEEDERKRNALKVEPYETENDSIGANIEFKPLSEDKEYYSKITSKYPLYRTPTMTIYRHLYLTQRNESGGVIGIPGMTRPVNDNTLWNKYNAFTTPIDQLLDEPPGGL